MTDLILLILIILGICSLPMYTKKQYKMAMWVIIIAMVVMFGLRHYSVGVDSSTYAYRYETLTELGVFEKGFVWLIKGLHFICSQYTCLFLTTSAIIWVGLLTFYKKYTNSYWLAIFLFCALGGINTVANNCMRQGIAIIIFLWALPFALQKKWILYFLSIGLAILFHRSAVFVLPIYFLIQLKFKWWKIIPLIVSFAFVLSFAEVITNYLFSDYERYLVEVERINIGKVVQSLVVSCIGLFPLYWRSITVSAQRDDALNNAFLWLIPLYLICAWGIYLSNVGRPLGRLSWYLFPIIFVNFANYLDSVPIKIRRLITISLIIIVFSFRLGVYWMSDMSSQADLIYYYKFFWQ